MGVGMIKKIFVVLLVIIVLLFTGCDKRSATEIYQDALQYTLEGDNLKAAAEYVRAYQSDKTMVLAYIGAIDTYKTLNIEYRIVECLDLLIQNCQDEPLGYVLATDYYLEKDDPDTAIEYCLKQMENLPTVSKGYMLAASIYFDQGNYENSLLYSKQVIELFQEEIDGYGYAIESLNMLKRNHEAVPIAESMLKQFPEEISPYIYLGYLLISENDYTKASDILNSCPNQLDNGIVSLKRTILGKEVITFSDPNFETAVRTFTGKKTGELLLEDVFNITYLDIVGGRNPKVVFDETPAPLDTAVESLDDLKYFESVISLTIRNHELEDFTPIASLEKLCILNLETTNVSDISFIRDNKHLISLTVKDGFLADFSAVSTLVDLEVIIIENNMVDSLPLFSELTRLSQVSLKSNQLSDITNLSTAYTVTTLDLSDNPDITDVESLGSLYNLIYLNLLGCNVSDFSPVSFVSSLSFG